MLVDTRIIKVHAINAIVTHVGINDGGYLLCCYQCYAFSVAIFTEGCIVSFRGNHLQDVGDESSFIYGLYIYFCIGNMVKFLFWFALFFCIDGFTNYLYHPRERANIDALVHADYCKDALEILMYRGKDLQDLLEEYKKRTLYGGKKGDIPDRSLLYMSLQAENEKLFKMLLEEGLEYTYYTERERSCGDYTALIQSIKSERKEYMEYILLSKWINLEYINKKYVK